MIEPIRIRPLQSTSDIEIAERKGLGHPDAICDQIAEEISVALCHYYIKEFGLILHHNVDKALLIAGQSQPAFGGGRLVKPMELILAGRATNEFKGRKIPVEEIVGNTVKNWIKKNLRFLDPEKDIRIVCRIGAGSQDLTELFQRFGKGEIPLANDTSMGVGFYPFTPLEQQVLQIEQLLNNVKTKQRFPWVGEDIKVMGLRTKTGAKFTIAVAMVDRFIPDIKAYQLHVAEIKQFISGKPGMEDTVIEINSADNYDQQSVYLTVTGLSAEAGDDGEVGRGNRYNGLITPYRPMSLEAFAGKNPVSHVGKIYNLFAFELSKAICEQGFAEEAQVFIVSQIGRPITEPQLLDIRVNRSLVDTGRIEQLARLKLEEIPTLWKQIISR